MAKNIIFVLAVLSVVFLHPQADADIRSKSPDLITAAKNNDIEQVATLLRRGLYVNKKDEEGNTPLIYAVKNGNIKMAEMLIAKRANVNTSSKENWTPLGCAIKNNDFKMVKLLLLKGADPNKKSWLDWTPLMRAATADSSGVQMVKLLLKKGARINTKDSSGGNAFYYAACAGKYDTAKYLAEQGADVNAKVRVSCHASGGNETVLMAAARVGNYRIAELAVKFGADLNTRRSDNKTALQIAEEGGHADIVNLIINSGGKK